MNTLSEVLTGFGYRAYSYDPVSRRLDEVDWRHERGNNLLAIADRDAAVERLRPQ